MDFYDFKIGSFAKGCAVQGLSDDDRCVITRASKDFYENIILNKRNDLTNINVITPPHDTKYMDILNAFMELINGKGATILLYGMGNNTINKNIIDFSRGVAEYNKKIICGNMVKFNINKEFDTDVKKVLSLLFNLSLVDKWLDSDVFPSDKFPEILKDDKRDVFYNLMKKRISLDVATPKEVNIVENYRSDLLKKVEKLNNPKKLQGMGKVIYEFLIYDKELYIPDQCLDDSINEIKYTPIPQLIDYKNTLLKDKVISIQKKVIGAHFRIIYNEGNVVFGNKEKCLLYNDDYYGYQRVVKESIKGVEKVYTFIRQKKIIIYGVLCGNYFNPIINDFEPIVKDVNYFDNKEKIQLYAYDIKIFDDKEKKYNFINFETVQIILKDAGFSIIPYEHKIYDEFIKNVEHDPVLFDYKKGRIGMVDVLRYNDIKYKV